MQNFKEISTSSGVFKVEYTGYFAGSAGSYDEPPEPASVEIINVYFVDQPKEYEEDLEFYLSSKSFMKELELNLITEIEEQLEAEKLEHYINVYNSEYC